MSDLISRDSLRTKIRQKFFDTRYDFELAMDVIKTIPAVNAKPVVHGKWIKANDGSHYCSICVANAGYTWDDIDRFYLYSADNVPDSPSNFCPNCGADMRGDTDV